MVSVPCFYFRLDLVRPENKTGDSTISITVYGNKIEITGIWRNASFIVNQEFEIKIKHRSVCPMPKLVNVESANRYRRMEGRWR